MKNFYDAITYDKLVKSQGEDPRWLDKKFDIQGVVFLAGSRLYIRYVEGLPKTCNAGDRTFYDAITYGKPVLTWKPKEKYGSQ